MKFMESITGWREAPPQWTFDMQNIFLLSKWRGGVSLNPMLPTFVTFSLSSVCVLFWNFNAAIRIVSNHGYVRPQFL